jgi:regulator of sigma E protease
VGLCLILAASTGGALSTLLTVLKVAFGIGFVIFVHELGHFLAAKMCGVKCEKFYVGFDVPPWRLFGLRMPTRFLSFRWGETEYGVGIIPLGGYVKMLGQDDNPSHAEKEAERIKVRQETAAGEQYVYDPRSYPAKSVPQRMFIISAGIIMNLIFAVIMAAVAYRAGVGYITCLISGAAPGSPAWKAGIEGGDKIVGFGTDNDVNEHLRFEQDLRPRVLMAGLRDRELPLQVRAPQGDTETYVLRPHRENEDVSPTIGVWFATSTTLGTEQHVIPYMAAGRADPPLKPGDRVVAVNGKTLDRLVTNQAGDFVSLMLNDELGREFREPIQLTVEGRSQPSVVPPSPMRWLGFHVRMGPIVAVKPGSRAYEAGFRPGDVISKINGEPIGNPITLPHRVQALAGTPVEFEVTRQVDQSGGRQTEIMIVEPDDQPLDLAVATHLGLNGLGLAYAVENVVGHVAEGSEAAKLGLPVGAQIQAVQFELPDDLQEKNGMIPTAKLELSDVISWATIAWQLQQVPPETTVRVFCQYINNGQPTKKEFVLAPRDLPGSYHIERGLNFTAYEQIHVAESWREATRLGVRETKEKLAEVFTVLGLLFSGRVSLDNLGGPIKIAAIAGHEAALGIPRLLLFLTFLSANLALLNALPIPVLDGGHFLFLTIEGIFRRPVSEKWQARLTVVGFLLIVGLMLFVFAKDIQWLARMLG